MAEPKGTVLVVDDEHEIREIIEAYVSSIGFDVLEASDGQEADEVVQKHHVDVVVSDLLMPRMSGIGLLESLRSRGFNNPFIFVTSFPSRDSTIQALRLGAFDYVEKPFNREELQNLLIEAMRVSKAQQAQQTTGQVPSGDVDDEKTAAEILKLRTLRFEQTGNPAGVAPQTNRVRDMFIDEVAPELTFCEAAIKGLSNPDTRTWDLGYLFRVMQTIANIAEKVELPPVAALANASANLYTALRVRPRSVNETVIDLAARTNEAMKDCIQSLASDDALPDNLGRLTQEIQARAEFVERDEIEESA